MAQAIVVGERGEPEVLRLQEWDVGAPGPGELLVDVTAAGVNFIEIYQREGRPPYDTAPLPYVPGSEGAGTVAALGPGVDGFAVGDRVAWTAAPGSYATQVLVPADKAVPVPGGVDLRTAAAVLLQGLTAHYLTTSVHDVERGDVCVVHAAAGGVGLLLTQLVKRRGGVVVATTSTPEKAQLALGAGADHLAGYDDFVEVTRAVTGGAGAPVVYDGVGRTTFDASLTALRPRGLMVLYGGASGPVPPFELQRLAAGGSLRITRPTLAHFTATREELLSRTDDLFAWIAASELAVSIGGTYPLVDARRAHEDLAGRLTTGKLLLLP